MVRRFALTLSLLMLAAACSGGTDVPRDGGLLAIVDESGDARVLTPEGELVTQLTDFGGTRLAFQPIWSGPDHVAVVEQTVVGGELLVADLAGREQRRAEFVTAPFYLYPRPGRGGSAEIVSLRNHLEGGLAAEVVREDGSVSALAGGFPFYFTWTASGDVVAHSESSTVGEVYPGRRLLSTSPGQFGAPASRDDDVVFVRRDAADSYLTVGSGEEAIDLAAVPGPAHLEVAGDRVAIRAVALAGPSDGVEVMARQTPRLPPDSLVVIDIEDGSAEIVADTGVVAFFWDADGRQLLYLESEGGARLSWHVWEGGSVRDLSSFSPDPVWVTTFLAFFDQYAQSMTLWAPDGSAFAFPGDIDGEAGVWVQHLDGSPPRLVASGSWVAWSPGG